MSRRCHAAMQTTMKKTTTTTTTTVGRGLCQRWYGSYTPQRISLTHRRPAPSESPQALRHPLDPSSIQSTLARIGVPGGASSLPDPLAAQVFTHKSFNHGKSGYNEKLAFLGRRVLELRLSQYLLSRPSSGPATAASTSSTSNDERTGAREGGAGVDVDSDGTIDGRDVSVLKAGRVGDLTTTERLGHLAMTLPGFTSALRWKPRDETDRLGSGEVVVAGKSLMALVGAIELHAGAAECRSFVQRVVIPGLDVFREPDGESVREHRSR